MKKMYIAPEMEENLMIGAELPMLASGGHNVGHEDDPFNSKRRGGDYGEEPEMPAESAWGN